MAPQLVRADGPLLDRILDLTHPLWGEGLDRGAYARYNDAQRRLPWGAARLHRLALVDGTDLLSTAKRYDLRVRIDGQEVGLAGIGAVFTPAPLRGHGWAGRMLQEVLDAAAAEGFGAALLFSEISPRYYERFGFRRLPVNQLALDLVGEARPGPRAIPMRCGEKGDLRAIVEMNAAQSAAFRLAMIRDADYVWQAIARKRLLAACGRPGHRKVEFFVVEEGGRAAAYLVLLEVGEYWMVTECGDRDPSGARVGAMLHTLLTREMPRRIHLRAWLPPGFLPPQLRVVAREIPPITMMMRPLGCHVHPRPPLRQREIAWWHADAF